MTFYTAEIQNQNHPLLGNGNHLIRTRQGWKPLKDLVLGDEILSDKDFLQVISIKVSGIPAEGQDA